MRGFGTLMLAVAVTACSGTQQPQNQQDPQIVVRSAEQDQLHQLDEMARNIGLKRAIIDSGMRCKRVIKSGYVTEYKKLSMWSALCDDNRQWAIFVGPDGSAQVRPCVDEERFKLPECKIGETEKERRGV